MWYVLTVWDEVNERHIIKFDSFDSAKEVAHWSIDEGGAEYVVVTNSQTGEELLSLFA